MAPGAVDDSNGGSLSIKQQDGVEEFCYGLRGKTPIHNILIANNGMVVVKFITSIRSWAYETFGSDKAVLMVSMAMPEDTRENVEHVKMADQFVRVLGGSNQCSKRH